MRRRFGPSHALTAGVALGLGVVLFATWLALHQPWIGVEFRAPLDGARLTVAHIDADGPAAGKLRPGDAILAVIDSRGTRVAVDASMMFENPMVLPSWPALDDHLRMSGAVHHALQAGPVELELESGTRLRLQAEARVPLGALRPEYALILLFTLLAWSICLSVWVYRPRDGAAQALALCGLGTLFIFTSGTVVNMRAWGLSEPVYQGLLLVNTSALNFAAFMFLAVIWYYPAPLSRFPFLTTATLLAVLAEAGGVARLSPHPGEIILPCVLAYTVATIPIAIAQWRVTRNQPLERAALKWLYLVTVLSAGFVAVTNNIPIALGLQPPLSNTPVLFAVATLFGGIAMGIVRYRLFNLDRWWFEAWMWALGGVLVIALDTLLLWFNASFGVALGVALVLAGWLWFPLRQWLWRWLSPAARQTVEQHLPQLIDSLFAARTGAELQHNWQELLRGIYDSLELRSVAESVEMPVISRAGLALRVPGLQQGTCVDLRHGHKGQRLFSTADVKLAKSLLGLARQALQARRAQDEQEARQQSQRREKELLVQDLHDGLGGAVTNIGLLAEMGARQGDIDAAHRALVAIAGLARESSSEIRSFMSTIEDVDADWRDVAADLRLCARAVLEPHAIEQEFTIALDDAAPMPDAMLRMNLLRAFKEALSNVVKHARASRVSIGLTVTSDRMRFAVSDDGAGFATNCHPPGAGDKSRGLRHLRERAAALGGELSLVSAPGIGTTVMLAVPLPAKSPFTGIAGDAATA